MINKYLKIFKESKLIFLFSIAEKIFFFIIFLFLARSFPTGIYGEIVTVFSLANIFAVIFDLGLPLLLQKEISTKGKYAASYFNKSIVVSIIIFPVYLLLFTAYSKLFYGEISLSIIVLTALLVYLYSTVNTLNKALSGFSDFKTQFRLLIFSRTITIILFITAILVFNINIVSLLIILLSGALMQVFLLIKNLRGKNLFISLKGIDFSGIVIMLKVSIPLGLAVIFNFLYDKIDIILISKLTGFDQVAYYNVAYGIYKTSVLAYSFIFVSGFTRISIIRNKKSAVLLFMRKYSVMLFWICAAITLLLFFFASPLIHLVYTEKFSGAILVLKILSFASIGLALNNLTGVILNGLGLFKMNMIITLIGLIINVILNVVFIPRYGINAAAVVTVITEYCIFTGGYLIIRNYLKRL